MEYSPQELMVAAAAREIGDGEVVFVGMRLPIIAFALARRTHAPGAIGLFENGLARDQPAPELLYTMGDPPNIAGALWCTDMFSVMSLLASGHKRRRDPRADRLGAARRARRRADAGAERG